MTHDITFDFDKSMTKTRRGEFARYLRELQDRIGFKISSRGWCYMLETARMINKDQFDKVERWIGKCQKSGDLPVDFVAEEDARIFSGIETPDMDTPVEFSRRYVKAVKDCWAWYTPDWWEDETFYIQMLVEKIDLKTLFEPVCHDYHIPIATSKGWSSVLQRAKYAKRFKEAEERGLKCVLLYCGDHDPDGLRISDFIRSNLDDLKDVVWSDGTEGYDPEHLEIQRFGLNYDFIIQHNLTWIDNLITGSGKNLASPAHKNFNMDYVQSYLNTYGARKCEANSIIPLPDVARAFVRDVIESYVGHDARDRFRRKVDAVREELQEFQDNTGLTETLNDVLERIDEFSESES